MPYKKTHPGLDETMSQEALDRFMAGAPTEMVEAPRQAWPTVATVTTVVVQVAVVLVILVPDPVTVADGVAVLAVTAVSGAVLWWLDQPGRRR